MLWIVLLGVWALIAVVFLAVPSDVVTDQVDWLLCVIWPVVVIVVLIHLMIKYKRKKKS